MLGVLLPGVTKPSDANVCNKDDWICYVAEENYRGKKE